MKRRGSGYELIHHSPPEIHKPSEISEAFQEVGYLKHLTMVPELVNEIESIQYQPAA